MEDPKINEYLDAYAEALKDYPEYESSLFELALFNKLFNNAMMDMEFLPASDKMEQDLKSFAWKMWKYGAAYDFPE